MTMNDMRGMRRASWRWMLGNAHAGANYESGSRGVSDVGVALQWSDDEITDSAELGYLWLLPGHTFNSSTPDSQSSTFSPDLNKNLLPDTVLLYTPSSSVPETRGEADSGEGKDWVIGVYSYVSVSWWGVKSGVSLCGWNACLGP
ncbi:hypothetical protein Tco_0960663 [Tanacetum coccineum]